jgi:hypothetical protein
VSDDDLDLIESVELAAELLNVARGRRKHVVLRVFGCALYQLAADAPNSLDKALAIIAGEARIIEAFNREKQ